MVTGLTDQDCYDKYEGVQRSYNKGLDITQCVHIFAEPTNTRMEAGSLKVPLSFCV